MNWFGFGFNGFGQIGPQRKDEQQHVRVLSPLRLELESQSAETFSGTEQKTEIERVVSCWSRSAVIHSAGERRCVCFYGADSSVLVCDTEGCEDVFLTESTLTLSSTHTVTCWSLHRHTAAVVWSTGVHSTQGDGHALPLPLVPGGYIASKPPFFRPLSLHLQAVSLALGTEHAVLLTACGTVYTWGHGSHGQLGHGTLVSEDEPCAVEALWGVPMKSVAAGGWHSACISAGGDLYIWGWNEKGQIGLPSKGLRDERQGEAESTAVHIGKDKKEDEDISNVLITIQAFPALVDVSEGSEMKKVSCGSRHTAAVTSTGDLYTWGWGFYGQLGHGSRCSSDEPKLVEFFPCGGMRVEDVTCGLWNTFVSAVPRECVSL